MLNNIFFVTLIVLRLVIGVALLISARRNKLPNLYWLAAVFLINFATLPFVAMTNNPLGNLPFSLWVFYMNSLSTFALIGFIHTTFYSGRVSPVKWLVGLQAIGFVMMVYGLLNSAHNFDQSPWVASAPIVNSIVWIWHAMVAYQAQQSIASHEQVEDWVKSRYSMMTAYSVLSFIVPAATAVRIIFAGGGDVTMLGKLMGMVSSALNIISITLQFLVWVMPEGFRKWLNRNQKLHTEERIHEQAQSVLNIIGAALSDGTGISKMLAVFSIRKAISNQIQSEDTTHVEARAASMGFDEWSALLKNPELYNLIKNSGPDVQTGVALEKARKSLIEKQSLFTMQAK